MAHHQPAGQYGYQPGFGYPPPPVVPKRGFSGLAVTLIATGTLLAGCVSGVVLGSASSTTPAAPGDRAAVPRSGQSNAPASEPAPAPAEPVPAETSAAEPYKPRPEDFKIAVKVLKKSCYGSAGCSISFRIDPSYSGPTLNPDQTYTVTYRITGGEDPKINSFEMLGTKASYDLRESISTSSSSDQLKAEVSEIL